MMSKMSNIVDVYVGARLRMRRTMLGMSQSRLGELLGVTFQQIQKYEKGSNRISASRLQHTARVLEVYPGYFFEGAPAEFGRTGFCRRILAILRGGLPCFDRRSSTQSSLSAGSRPQSAAAHRQPSHCASVAARRGRGRRNRSINRTKKSERLDGPNGRCQKHRRAAWLDLQAVRSEATAASRRSSKNGSSKLRIHQ